MAGRSKICRCVSRSLEYLYRVRNTAGSSDLGVLNYPARDLSDAYQNVNGKTCVANKGLMTACCDEHTSGRIKVVKDASGAKRYSGWSQLTPSRMRALEGGRYTWPKEVDNDDRPDIYFKIQAIGGRALWGLGQWFDDRVLYDASWRSHTRALRRDVSQGILGDPLSLWTSIKMWGREIVILKKIRTITRNKNSCDMRRLLIGQI